MRRYSRSRSSSRLSRTESSSATSYSSLTEDASSYEDSEWTQSSDSGCSSDEEEEEEDDSRSTSRSWRNRSCSPEARRSRSEAIRTTAVRIERTDALREQDRLFERLRSSPEMQQEWNKRHPPDVLVAYTDGSCLKPPDGSESSGFGVYFGPGHELNRAERIEGELHNSCLAEILAARRALELILTWPAYSSQAVIVRTDFLPLIQVMSKGAPKSGAVFHSHYCDLLRTAQTMPQGVRFEHVYGHGDDPGNQAADELARQAAATLHRRAGGHRARSECRVKDLSGVRGRAASRQNNREHIRSHSAFVVRRRRSN